MATSKQKKDADPAQTAQVEKRVDAIEDKGYIGRKVDPLPNSAHSQESGPDGPPIAEVGQRVAQINHDDLEED